MPHLCCADARTGYIHDKRNCSKQNQKRSKKAYRKKLVKQRRQQLVHLAAQAAAASDASQEHASTHADMPIACPAAPRPLGPSRLATCTYAEQPPSAGALQNAPVTSHAPTRQSVSPATHHTGDVSAQMPEAAAASEAPKAIGTTNTAASGPADLPTAAVFPASPASCHLLQSCVTSPNKVGVSQSFDYARCHCMLCCAAGLRKCCSYTTLLLALWTQDLH